MRLARALRTAAIAIAIAAVADPVFTIGRWARQPLTIAVIDTPTLVLPDIGGTRLEHATRVAQTLHGQLSDVFAITIRHHPLESDADPCPIADACIVISDGAMPAGLAARDQALGSIRVGTPVTPNVAIDAVDSPRQTNRGARAPLRVHLSGAGVAGQTTGIRVFDGPVLVGSDSYTWPQASATTPATVMRRLEWAPIETALRDIRVVADKTGGERSLLDNERHVAVDVIDRSSVVVYEPQPTWNGTFIRRALESDPRFVIASRSRVGNAISVGRGDVRLDSKTLSGIKASAVLVTSPQLLTSPEVEVLDRYVRLRGGSLVVVLDGRPTGPIQQLLPRVTNERHEATPFEIGQLKATEVIVSDPGPTGTILAAIDKDAVVVATALGHGRIVVSGASDAWRYRADGQQFSSFWRALVADAVMAGGDPLMVTLSKTSVGPGEYVDIEVEARSTLPLPAVYEAAARLRCGHESTPIRLWPSGANRFSGRVVASEPGQCRVVASVTTLDDSSAPLSIQTTAVPHADRDDLSLAIRAYGGTAVTAGNEGALVTRLRASAASTTVATEAHPMQSPLWIVPFALCLSGEWWLRRRQGRT
jgi:hypothetical protein